MSGLAQGIRYVAAAKFGGQMVSWSVTLFMYRLLGPADYALVAMCGSVTLLLGILADFGLGASLVQQKKLDPDVVRGVFGVSLLFAVLLCGLIWLLSPWIALYFRAPELKLLVQVASLQVLAGALLTPSMARINHAGAYRKIALLELVFVLVTTSAALALALQGFGPLAVVAGPVLGFFVKALVAAFLAGGFVRPALNWSSARSALAFGGKVSVGHLVFFLAGQSFILIGGRYLEREQFGFFSVAYDLAFVPLSKLMGVLNQVLYPEVARRKREQDADPAALLRGYNLLFLILLPLYLGMAITAPSWVPVVLGSQWLPTVLPMQIICLALPIHAMSNVHSTVTLGLGAVDRFMGHMAINLLVCVACVAVLLPFGASGLAAAVLLAFPLAATANVWLARHITGYSLVDVARASRAALVSSLCMGVMAVTLEWALGDWSAGARLLVIVPACGIVYVGVLWLAFRPQLLDLLLIAGLRR